MTSLVEHDTFNAVINQVEEAKAAHEGDCDSLFDLEGAAADCSAADNATMPSRADPEYIHDYVTCPHQQVNVLAKHTGRGPVTCGAQYSLMLFVTG